MPEFLVELYHSRVDAPTSRAAERVRRAAEELSREGTPIRYQRSIYVPDEETCFYLYTAGSIEAVREAARRAGLRYEHISEAVAEPRGDTAATADEHEGDR
jgi:Nickel responsive protein SCO4226-like